MRTSLSSLSVVTSFFLRTLAWLVLMLAIWYAARNVVVKLPAALADWAMGLFFGRWVEGTMLEGTIQSLLTTIPVPHASGQVALATPEVHILSYCYGLPLLFALFLAAKAKGLWWKLPLGVVALAPFQAWGICFAWLVTVAVNTSDVTAVVTRFTQTDVTLIGLGYQLGYLLFPAMVPILLWVYLERRFVATVAVEGAMSATV